ncbi:DNA/RNA nuclease SfsA [uncultured Ruminococcus sp.]|uniref:DNA/RNA nuclease SfsA n=1 Tax=uncultured Ruminococcus sp. TaxID=165186 RepID=UPI002623118C|nr:DNA/RNA nuclease SfsA [uncultured Ruminococcus sp.]
MKYKQIISGIFLERPNRFIAHVEIDGVPEIVHVKNTGRCKELLLSGSTVYLSVADNPSRKTKYDLIAVEKQRDGAPPLLINMDSQIPNAAAEEWLRTGTLFSPHAVIRREVTYGNSRFDFFVTDGERKAFLEVKGVTLEEKGIAMFPDAPTERGVKHLRELIQCRQDGYEAYVLFVIQMKEMTAFRPNDMTHSAFGDALREADRTGVKILAMDCAVTPDSIVLDEAVPVQLD